MRTQGWSVSAIARHLGLDRKTVRAHLAGGRQAGVRASSGADPFNGGPSTKRYSNVKFILQWRAEQLLGQTVRRPGRLSDHLVPFNGGPGNCPAKRS